MRYTSWLCALLGAVLLGCQPPPAPSTPERYAPPTHEVTNGVCIVFDAVPAPDLVHQLTGAGAIISTNGTSFVFDAVNTDARRQAVRAALLSGATLKGMPK